MTSTAKRTCKAGQGFTLVEIVIVLVISALIFGGALGVMTFSSDEYALKKAAREVEGLAKRARATSILKQTPYALEFTPGMVKLMPWAEAMDEEQLEAQHIEMDEDVVDDGAVRWELSLDNGMRSQLRRWDSDEWIQMEDGVTEVWRFDPNGLCEPIALELALDDGRITMEFNPLTAAINVTTYQTQ